MRSFMCKCIVVWYVVKDKQIRYCIFNSEADARYKMKHIRSWERLEFTKEIRYYSPKAIKYYKSRKFNDPINSKQINQ